MEGPTELPKFWVFVSNVFDSKLSGRPYARLSRTTSKDEGDRSTFAVNNVVAGAASTTKAELALLDIDRRSHGDGSCVEQVRDGSCVLHFGCCRKLIDLLIVENVVEKNVVTRKRRRQVLVE